MSAEREKELFLAGFAIESPADRAAFLDQACGGDSALRQRVDALFEAQTENRSFLEHPAAELAATQMFGDTDAEAKFADGPTLPELDDVSLDFLDPAQQDRSLGRLGQYEVLEVVGRGGMGIVLKAHDTKLQRVVAVKVLSPELASNATARKRFLREAQAAAAISHDHVVTIHAVEENERPGQKGLPYLVMEFIDGQSLQQKIDHEGHLELKEVLRIGRQIAAGLAAAHAQGLIHRDVKPSNILLQNGIERVQITDFGLARAVDDVGITRTGEVTGTPQYMSPEQAQGHPVDARSDLFSLGSVLYAMCTGRSPFRADTSVAALRRVCDDTPRPIREINPDVPEWLVEIVVRLLAKDPDNRFQTATEVAELLGKHLAHLQDPGTTPFPGTVRPARRHSATGRRRRWLVAALALLALATTIGVTEGTGVTQLAATVIRLATGEGTLVIEVDDPSVQISLDGEEVSIKGAGIQELKLRPGQYRFQATKDGQPVKQELVSISRGGRAVVNVTLERVNTRRAVGKADDATSQGGFEKAALGALPTIPKVRGFSTCTSQVVAVAFSPDGRLALTGGGAAADAGSDTSDSEEYSLQLWDVERGTEIRRFRGHRDIVVSVAFSPDGRRALSGGRDGDRTLRLWDVETGEQLRLITGHSGAVRCVAFLPDGKHAVSGGGGTGKRDGNLILWDLDSGEEVRRFNIRAWSLWDVAVSEDGRRALCGGGTECISRRVLWDLETGDLIQRFEGTGPFEKGQRSVRSVALLPDGARAVSADMGGTIRVWDLESGREVRRFVTAFKYLSSMAVLPDGRRLVVNGYLHDGNGAIWLYDLETGKAVASFAGNGQFQVAVAADGEWALAGSQTKVAHLWRIPEAGESLEIPVIEASRVLAKHEDSVNAVAFSPNGQLAATAGGDRLPGYHPGTDFDIRIWDVESGKQLHCLSGHISSVSCLTFSPDGHYVLTGSRDMSLRLWDVVSGEEVRQFQGHTRRVQCAAFSPDGRFILSGGFDSRLIKWSVADGRKLWDRKIESEVDFDVVWCVAFSPDGKLGLSGHGNNLPDGDGHLRLWNIDTGEQIRRIDGHTRQPRGVLFTDDGERAISAGFGGVIRTWDVASGKEIGRIDHDNFFTSLAITPDGKRLLTAGPHSNRAGRNGPILWNLLTGTPSHVLTGDGIVFPHGVAVSPDGRLALAGCLNGTARLWNLPELNAFVVLGDDGAEEVRFDTLAEAVAVSGPGDTIEIRGNGPFATGPIEINHALTIRAGDGFCPKIVGERTADTRNLLTAQGPLVLEGLDIQWTDAANARRWGNIVEAESTLGVLNCRFQNDSATGESLSARGNCIVRNCQFNSAVNWQPGGGGNCLVENCVSTDTLCIHHSGVTEKSLELTKNTFRTPAPLGFLPREKAMNNPTKGVRIHAAYNVFDAFSNMCSFHLNTDPLERSYELDELEAFLRAVVEWQEHQNLHSARSALLGIGADGKLLEWDGGKDLESWNRFWGLADTGSLQGSISYQGGEPWGKARKAPEQLTAEDFRLTPDSAGYQAGPDGKDLGADVDLVGPGEAYERWKKTPEYQQWLEEIEQLQQVEVSTTVPLELVRRFAENDAPWVTALAYAPDGESVVTSSPDGLDVWRLETGEQVRRIEAPAAELTGFGFLDDGTCLVGVTREGRLLGREWPSGEVRFDVEAHARQGMHSVLLSDSRIATTGDDGFVRIWDARTGRKLSELRDPESDGQFRYFCLAVSPDERYLAAGGHGLVDVWDLQQGRLVHRLPYPGYNVHSVPFSPDGRHVLAGGSSGLILMFELDSGDLVRRFKEHRSGVMSLLFLPDGRHFVSGSLDGTLRVWAPDGREVARHESSQNDVSALVLTPDGRHVVSSGRKPVAYDNQKEPTGTTLQLWELPASVWPERDADEPPSADALPDVEDTQFEERDRFAPAIAEKPPPITDN